MVFRKKTPCLMAAIHTITLLTLTVAFMTCCEKLGGFEKRGAKIAVVAHPFISRRTEEILPWFKNLFCYVQW